MELSELATQENSDEGVWKQVVLYGEKQPFEILIYGSDSDVVQKFNRKQLKKIKVGSDSKKLSDDDIDELLDNATENVVVRIGGLRSLDGTPLSLFGKELKNDKESYHALLKNIPSLKDFILKVSGERSNFLSNRKES